MLSLRVISRKIYKKKLNFILILALFITLERLAEVFSTTYNVPFTYLIFFFLKKYRGIGNIKKFRINVVNTKSEKEKEKRKSRRR